MSKTLLLIAAVAVMLLAVTNVHAYSEAWLGWFRTGALYYDGNTYVHSDTLTHGTASDTTYSVTRDTFWDFIWTVQKTFVYSAGDDTIYLSVTSLFTGGKDTGQSGTKEGNGVWLGTTICTVDNNRYSVWGTWDTGIPIDYYYFNYNSTPPTYTVRWRITGGAIGCPTGYGTSYGEKMNY
ncbi:MAG: hypothetical protein U9Q76_09220 [candidate division WOR-3 bacterium]|nr:hypothetical protein [candidate division WOR-3 bacterium]